MLAVAMKVAKDAPKEGVGTGRPRNDVGILTPQQARDEVDKQ